MNLRYLPPPLLAQLREQILTATSFSWQIQHELGIWRNGPRALRLSLFPAVRVTLKELPISSADADRILEDAVTALERALPAQIGHPADYAVARLRLEFLHQIVRGISLHPILRDRPEAAARSHREDIPRDVQAALRSLIRELRNEDGSTRVRWILADITAAREPKWSDPVLERGLHDAALAIQRFADQVDEAELLEFATLQLRHAAAAPVEDEMLR